MSKNIRKILSGKYSQKLLDHAKQYATDVLKTASNRKIKITSEATSDLIGIKIADKITKVSIISAQTCSEAILSMIK